MVSDIRESIHLESVGGRSPLGEFIKTVSKAFEDMEQRIIEGVNETLVSLSERPGGAGLKAEDPKGPASTWTYLINDAEFEEMQRIHNIGFTAAAAGYWGPLYLLMRLVKRYYRRR